MASPKDIQIAVLHVLIVEDSEADAELILRELRSGTEHIEFVRIDTQQALLEALEQPWDIVICDYRLPGFDALAALALVRKHNPYLPFIIVSGNIGEETAVDAMKLGADDYVMKRNLRRLLPAIRRELSTYETRQSNARALAALQESEERFRQIADNIQEIFFLLSAGHSFAVLYVNSAFEDIHGCSRDIIRSTPDAWFNFIHPDDRDRIRGLYKEGMAFGELDLEYRIMRPDGSIRWLHIRAYPIFDASGKPYRIAGVGSDITERNEIAQKLERRTNYDTLTGLANRELLSDRLQQEIAHARRRTYTLAVLFIGLDRFKFVNDSLGHSAGDALLQIIAERLQACVREADTVARVGGDEFVLILHDLSKGEATFDMTLSIVDPETSAYQNLELLERILLAVSQKTVLMGHEISITCSIGVSFYPEDGSDAETLLQNADIARRHAKESGRNNYQFYTATLSTRIGDSLTLHNALRQALEQGQFVLYYQPKVDLMSDRTLSVEALLRWHSPEQGVVPPNRFIPILEETGLIIEVGRWVMTQAVLVHRQWQGQGRLPLRIAVNVSEVQLRQKGFVRSLEKIMKTALENGAAGLDLEITESLFMRDIESNISKLKAIRDMGIGIAIDDFGTGYCSLSYLARLPVNALKIDRSFIMNLAAYTIEFTIVSTMISLAHSLNLKVIAEGVETEEQLKLLRQLQCDEIQGYLISPALPEMEFWEWHDRLNS